MKTSVTFLLALFIITINFAQNGINYKAVVKDANGNVVANDLIVVQFTILKSRALTNIYTENHTPTTDTNGIIMINIGEGNVISGSFLNIDWGSDSHFLNVKINTGPGLVDMGTTEFKTVPYALHAKSSEDIVSMLNDLSDAKSDNDGTNNGSSLFIGLDAGINDDGSDNRNLGIGFQALHLNSTGRNNTAVGYKALESNTTGVSNSGSGIGALASNTTGNSNTAFGEFALNSNIDAETNTAVGSLALYNNTTGDGNNALGYRALFNNKTGNYNTAIGIIAMNSNTSGSYNTALGRGALDNNTLGSNNIAIGYNANVPSAVSSNQVRIGNTQISYAGVQVAWAVPSDKRWKDNIRELPFGLEFVKQLKPVDYIRKNNENKTREMGFIAQDLEELLSKIGYTDQGFLSKDEDGYLSVRYNDFIALLTNAIQEQQKIIESQKTEIKTEKQINKTQSEQLEALFKRMETLENNSFR